MDYSYIPGTQAEPFSLYSLHGLPTPDHPSQTSQTDDLQEAFMNYPGNANRTANNTNQQYPFDPSSFGGLDPNTTTTPFVQPPPSLPQSPPDSATQPSDNGRSNTLAGGGRNTVAESVLGRSSSEEKDGLSADPNKRKAQNRAAQRAFRERKERHVKDLETKVTSLEDASTSLSADNERLKHELARFATENEILRATNNGSTNLVKNEHNSPDGHHSHHDTEPTTGPMVYKPMDLTTSPDLVTTSTSSSFPSKAATANSDSHNDNEVNPRHRMAFCPLTGDKLLDTSATWELIQSHDLFERGLVDIEDVSTRLRRIAQCNGQGPAFREGEIRKAIEESAAAAADGRSGGARGAN